MRYLALLPVFFSAVLLFLLVKRLFARSGPVRGRYLPFFLTAVCFAALTVVLTEGLSAFSALSPRGLAAAWWASAALLAVLVFLFWRISPRPPAAKASRKNIPAPNALSSLRLRLRAELGAAFEGAARADGTSILLGSALILLLALTLAVAIVYPPNNYDSMAYHVARVMHWAQQRSVAYYPTAIVMQLQGAPLAEFFLLHLYVLTGSDALFNLVQWTSFLLAVLAVYSAADLLFPRSGLTAALLAAAIPMGVLQASSTQNDLFAASWLAVSVYLGLCVLRDSKVTRLLPFTTLALGLAILSKPTVFLMAGSFTIVFLGSLLLRRVPVRVLALSAGLVFLPSIPFYARNLAFYGFGSPYGPTYRLQVEEVSVRGVISNVIRNMALHSQTPLRGFVFDTFNSASLGALRMFHEVLRVPVDDPRWSLTRADAFQPNRVFHEDISGNPLHLVLFLALLPIAVVWAFRASSPVTEDVQRVVARRALPLMACVGVGFVTLWGYLKWSQFASRFDLALFVVACVPLGGLLGAVRRPGRTIVLVGFLCYAFAAVCLNATRPVSPPLSTSRFDRRASYFANHPDFLTPYMEIARAIKTAECHQVGYRNGNDNFEYPFWVVLREGGYWFRFEHFEFIVHSSSRLRDASFEPCAVISLDALPGYEVVFEDVRVGAYHLYLKRGRP